MMKHGKSNIGIRRSQKGFALVVILAFMVLLTVLVLAYFSYSSLQRQISSANSNQATVNVFSQGAINTIVSDLKQEIFTNSTVVTVGTNTITIPLAQSNAVPERVGASANLPNLVKRSAGGLAFFDGGPARASSSSTTNASQNGRSISSARWNAAMLLPKAAPNTTDLTPANFTPPDWIYVNRNGGNPTSWSPDMAWSGGVTNTNTVIGRYAYAIYDEGGLLDVNVAGHPPGMANTITSYKSALAYADLTQIGINTNTISALVGWRNTATAQPGSSFPNYTFSGASQTNFAKAISTSSTGFLRPANTTLVGGESDRQFVSRQQLIQFFNTLAGASLQTEAELQNALQYLGTFSRGLEQPSFAPDPLRPKVIGTFAPPAAGGSPGVDAYQGNNDAWGGDDQINPSFLSIRAAAAFSRNDGTQAVIGEPLVKKRFPLSRLAWITFEGPVSGASTATKNALLNAGVSQATIDAGTSSNILKCFGMTWNSSSKIWTYNHGSAAIMTLSQVAAANREPDFLELLKASINAGSLAKGGPNLKNYEGNYQYTLDTSVDYNLLQIAVNLIDQFDSDSYPTQVQVSAGTTLRTFRGIEDLPYFYRYHPFSVVTRLPSPLLAKTQQVLFLDESNNGAGRSLVRCVPASGTGLTDPGEAVMMYIPEVWNPHDALALTTGSSGPRPTEFQLVAVTADPALPSPQTPAWEIRAKPQVEGDDPNQSKSIIPDASQPQSPPLILTESNTGLTFSDNSGALFREPTLLWRTNAPAGANLSIVSGNALGGPVTDVNTGNQYLGIPVGITPISTIATAKFPGTPQDPNNLYIFQSNEVAPQGKTTPGAYQQITFRLKYKHPGGNWITYDEKYPDLHGLYRSTLVVNKADFPQEGWRNPFRTDQLSDTATSYDPRTARFGIGTANTLYRDGTKVFLEPSPAANYSTDTIAGNTAIGNSLFTIIQTQRPGTQTGNYANYSNPCMTSDPGKNPQMRWFSGSEYRAGNAMDGPYWFDGLMSQNNPQVELTAQNGSANARLFNEDPDGIARRAMGAYVPVGGINTPATSTIGLPLATANTYGSGGLGVGTPTSQNQSRPLILNRPFQSVGEMSYAFRGGLWKQLDFFTPESGDTALLDTFCINESPSDPLVAGKLNLNTGQAPVLKAVLAGAYREELANRTGSLPSGTLTTPLSATEIDNIANKLVSITTDTTNAWRGPLANISQIVGRFVPNPGTIGSATDVYQFTEPVTKVNYTYAGFSAALDSSVYGSATAATIQRLREAAIRPLASVGQVRVWNLMVDVVAQVGRYPASATSMDQFTVEGEARFWVHLAIDRMTGEVIDKQVELVTE